MNDELTTLTGTERAVWDMLGRALADPEAPARTIALATQANGGGGAVRIVVLRAIDRNAQTLAIYTHRASSKIEEIRFEPKAEALVWDPARQFQVRLRGALGISDGPQSIWATFGPGTRRNYAATPLPGAAVPSPAEVIPEPDPSAFVVLTLKITAIETLWLQADYQHRALFTNGRARWIAP